MTIRHILFDLDGTLTDPKLGITQSIQYALRKLKQPEPAIDDLTWCIGPPLTGCFSRILHTDNEALLDQALQAYRERFATVGKFENQVYSQIPESLATLRQAGALLYIATSKPRVYTQDILNHFHLSQYFHCIFGSELDGKRSEKCDLIAYILDTEQIPGEACIMVGDRRFDIEGARANGLKSLGVTYGYGTHQELVKAGATFLADTPAALCDRLLSLIL